MSSSVPIARQAWSSSVRARVPLATARDRQDFLAVAGSQGRRALTNNRYSADIIAITDATSGLADLPDLRGDNPLPRWLGEVAGYEVSDLRNRWHLAIDIDGPLDMVLTGGGRADRGAARAPATTSDRRRIVLAGSTRIAADGHAELLVAGRTSAASVAWLERRTASRTRVFLEERGLRTSVPGQRPAASVLGLLLDRHGPEALGGHSGPAGRRGDRRQPGPVGPPIWLRRRGWPAAEDRFASDLLLTDKIVDPWVRALTASALDAPIPVVLGGHTLVGPGVRLCSARSPVAGSSLMDITPDLRRDPLPDLADVGEDEALVARIRAEIARDGPMPFARFMELALYDPDGGYYRGSDARPGRGGDFLTAPELHPIFGRAVARLLVDIWRRPAEPFHVSCASTGAGTGALAAFHARCAPRRPMRRCSTRSPTNRSTSTPGASPLNSSRD